MHRMTRKKSRSLSAVRWPTASSPWPRCGIYTIRSVQRCHKMKSHLICCARRCRGSERSVIALWWAREGNKFTAPCLVLASARRTRSRNSSCSSSSVRIRCHLREWARQRPSPAWALTPRSYPASWKSSQRNSRPSLTYPSPSNAAIFLTESLRAALWKFVQTSMSQWTRCNSHVLTLRPHPKVKNKSSSRCNTISRRYHRTRVSRSRFRRLVSLNQAL